MEASQGRCMTVVLFSSICLFAVSSWIGVNGLWSEIPLLVEVLPEGWNLPSYVVIIIQLANVGPIAYVALKKFKPHLVKEWIGSCVIIVIGIVASLLLAFTWNMTTRVGSQLHSTALLILSFFLATVDCTSSVVYLPYMARFRSPIFLTALYVGESLSGLIPSLVCLGQMRKSHANGTTGEDAMASILNDSILEGLTAASHPELRFSVGVFFLLLAILLTVSLVSFLFVNFYSGFDAFKTGERRQQSGLTPDDDFTESFGEIMYGGHPTFVSSLESRNSLSSSSTAGIYTETVVLDNSKKNVKKIVVLYLLVILVNALNNGVLPSVQSYACMPYGSLTYHLAVKLSIMINPLICLLTLFFMAKRLPVISAVTLLGTAMAAYQIFLAALSPHPILNDGKIGIVLAIVTSVLTSACFSYVKVCITTVLSELGGERLLLNCGALTQAGSLVGAIVGFLLVDVFHTFKSQ